MQSLAVYIHYPFCRRVCPFCDFNVYAAPKDQADIVNYHQALLKEIDLYSEPLARSNLISIYFGGGTPSLQSPQQMLELIKSIHDRVGAIDSEVEVTIEIEPGTATAKSLHEMTQVGINRVSIGVQSLQPQLLKRCARLYDAEAAETLIDVAIAEFGLTVSADLIFALPGETFEEWQADVDALSKKSIQHLSTYQLTIEDGTPFATAFAKNRKFVPDDDAQSQMYLYTISALRDHGFEHYEQSNFARSGHRSKHNQQYWNQQPYLGIGAGAHSYMNRTRWWNIKQPKQYAKSLLQNALPIDSKEVIDSTRFLNESLLLGLRKRSGIYLDDFFQRTGVDLLRSRHSQLQPMKDAGLLQIDAGRLWLTDSGMALSDSVVAELALDSTP